VSRDAERVVAEYRRLAAAASGYDRAYKQAELNALADLVEAGETLVGEVRACARVMARDRPAQTDYTPVNEANSFDEKLTALAKALGVEGE
jgi:hypothetical protein